MLVWKANKLIIVSYQSPPAYFVLLKKTTDNNIIS